MIFLACGAVTTDTYGFAFCRRAFVSAASQARRGFFMASKKPFTRIGTATLLSGMFVATTQKPHDDAHHPATDAILRSLWNSKELPKNGGIKKSDVPFTGKFYDAFTGTHLTMTSGKDQESDCVIESESYQEETIKNVQSKPKFWLQLGRVATFEFPKPPQLGVGDDTWVELTIGDDDPYTKCKATITFPNNTKDPSVLKAEKRVRCTTKLSREQYFGALQRISEEDDSPASGPRRADRQSGMKSKL